MEIFYVSTPNIYIAIDDGETFSIQRNTKRTINPHATVVQSLSATPFDDHRIEDGTLYLDGLMLVELAAWLAKEKPGVSSKVFGKMFFDLFKGGDGALLPDTVKAVCRVVLNATNNAAGEDAYFAEQQWRQHPQEFADLMLAYIVSR